MARLTCAAGTIVHADGDLEAKLRLQGWTDPVEPAAAPEVDTQDEDAPDDPPAPAKRGPGRPRKSE